MKKLFTFFTASMLFLTAGLSFANPDYASSKYSYITLDGQTHAVIKEETPKEVVTAKRVIQPSPKEVMPHVPEYIVQNKKVTAAQEELNNFHNGGRQRTPNVDPIQMGLNKAGNFASEKAEDVLNQYGTARVIMNGSNKFKTGSADILIPLHSFTEKDKSLVFTQIGARRSNLLSSEHRTTINMGLGYRYFADNGWMYGINGFYDHDVTRGHQRAGMGFEAWTDNFKFSANTYRRISDWKDSPSLIGYQERPANGFDVRAEGSLPSLPQISGKIMYEKYSGEQVGLFGETNRQKDAGAVTVALNYKPVPLLSIGVEHRAGQDGRSESKFQIALNYRIGVPMSKQLDSSRVGESRQLRMTRTDIVERNNEIVLEYQVKPIGSIRLPNLVNGNPTSVITFPIAIVANTALSNYTWSGTGAAFMSPYQPGSSSGEMTLPIFSTTTTNTYTLQLSARDIHGRLVQSNVLNIIVDGYTLTIVPSKSTAVADGVDSVTFTARLVDKNNVPVTNQPITWAARNGAIQSSQPTTNANGEVQLVLTSTTPGVAEVDAMYALQNLKATGSVVFTSVPLVIEVFSIVSQHTSIMADGTSVTILTANVRDSNGNIVPNHPVTWSTSFGTLSAFVTNTDASGNAVVTLRSSTTAGMANVLAKATTVDAGRNTNVEFVAPTPVTISVFSIVSQHTSILADGTSVTTLTANVRDSNGNIVPNHVVNWGTNLGSLTGSTSTTDASGNAVITLRSATTAGMAAVLANAGSGDAGRNTNVEFTAPPAVVIEVFSIVSQHASILADGTSVTTLTANVRDSNGNIVPNHPVTWTTNLGTLSASTSTTDANGNAVITLRSATTAGMANVLAKASVPDSGENTNVEFTATPLIVMVNTITAPPSIEVTNTSTVLVTAEVTDQYGNRLGAGHVVTWTQTSPAGTLQHATSMTDINGIATNVFTTGTVAGTATINASAGGTAAKSVVIQLLANTAQARVVDMTPSLLNGEANNTTEIYFFVKVTDGYGNLYNASQNVLVYWTNNIGTLSVTQSMVTGSLSRADTLLRASHYSGVGQVTVRAHGSDPGMTATITYAKLDENRQDNENYFEFYNCGSPTFDTTQATYLVWDGKEVANGLVTLPYTDSLGYTYSYYGTMRNDNSGTPMPCGNGQQGYRATSGVNRVSQ